MAVHFFPKVHKTNDVSDNLHPVGMHTKNLL